MSVTVEKQTLHETKGDSVAKGEQGLFNFKPQNVVLYVGGYPSSFTVRWAGQASSGGGHGVGMLFLLLL